MVLFKINIDTCRYFKNEYQSKRYKTLKRKYTWRFIRNKELIETILELHFYKDNTAWVTITKTVWRKEEKRFNGKYIFFSTKSYALQREALLTLLLNILDGHNLVILK